jgi:glycerophosphoryl diester phosphodiesterase
LSRLLSLSDVSVIAHRGGSKLRPENTLAAFDHAATLHVDAFECDVHLSRDREPVVIHDPTLERTTDAHGRVSDLTAAELARIDAGYRFGEDRGFPHRGEGGVPSLRELLTRHPAMPMIVEIKGDQPDAADRVVDVLRDVGAERRVVIGGFSRPVLDAVRRAAPEIATGASSPEARWALRCSYLGMAPRRVKFQSMQMPFRLRGRQMFGLGFVRAVRRGHIPIAAWIVDAPEDMRQLLEWGVTGIITDRPDIAISEMGQWGNGAMGQ